MTKFQFSNTNSLLESFNECYVLIKVGVELSSAEDLTLTKALGEYDLGKFENIISKEGERASKEYQIEKALQL